MNQPQDAAEAWRRWQEEVRWSAEHALEYAPADLLAFSCAVLPGTRQARLKAHFDAQPGEDDIDAIQAVESEVTAYLPEDFDVETEIEIVPAGRPPAYLPAIAYRRSGAGL